MQIGPLANIPEVCRGGRDTPTGASSSTHLENDKAAGLRTLMTAGDVMVGTFWRWGLTHGSCCFASLDRPLCAPAESEESHSVARCMARERPFEKYPSGVRALPPGRSGIDHAVHKRGFRAVSRELERAGLEASAGQLLLLF